MKAGSLILLFALFVSVAQAQVATPTPIPTATPVATPAATPTATPATTEVQTKATRGVSFVLDVLNAGQIEKLNQKINEAFQLEIEFEDGCESRAYLISRYLFTQKIRNGLIYVEESPNEVINPRTGELMSWSYHVAVTVLDKDGKLWIFDPFFLNSLLPFEKWLSLLTSLTTYQFKDGVLQTEETYARILMMNPYFYMAPFKMDPDLVEVLNDWDQVAIDDVVAMFPKAAASFGISSSEVPPFKTFEFP